MIRILCFGNSLTAGTPGYEPEYGWGDLKSQYGYWIIRFAEKDGFSNISFDNRGVPGELARWMPNRLSHLLQNSSYSYAIILGGSNDIGWQDTPDEIIDYLLDLWKIAIERGIKVIACTIPPIGAYYPTIQAAQKELNQLIASCVDEFDGVSIVDTFNGLANADGLLRYEYDSGDGLHLSVEGYKRMGELIWKESLHSMLNKEL